jgi:threonine synthase
MQRMPRDPAVPRVLLSTASPYKFPRVVDESLGLDVSGSDFDCMDTLAAATGTTAPKSLRDLEHAQPRFDGAIDIDAMRDAVKDAAAKL